MVAALALAGLGIYIVSKAWLWTYTGPDGPGPGFFPLWYGFLMVALSLVLIVQKFVAPIEGDSESGPIDWGGLGRALSTFLAFAVAIALLQVLGFFISLGLLTFFVVFVIYRQSLLTSLITSVLVSAGFSIFPLGLEVRLPVGVLGF